MNDGQIDMGTNPPETSIAFPTKSLSELYGPGNGVESVDPMNAIFMPLYLGIEEAIAHYFRADPSLTDGAVSLALDRLGMSPEADAGENMLVEDVQLQLRLVLSANNYSRAEVRAAIRKVGKSVARHTRSQGPRGYLYFICEQLRI